MKDVFRLFACEVKFAEILALFWSWYVVNLQLPFSNFSEKKNSAAIYFPPLLQCKTNTSTLEILTEMT